MGAGAQSGGRDQRKGALPRIFAVTAVVCWAAFTVWFLATLDPKDADF